MKILAIIAILVSLVAGAFALDTWFRDEELSSELLLYGGGAVLFLVIGIANLRSKKRGGASG